MNSRLKYFFPLLLIFLLPLSAYAWDPTNVTATAGACGTGEIDLSWTTPYSREGGAVNVGSYADTLNTTFTSGQSLSTSTTIYVPRSLPPGKYTVTAGVYDPGWDSPALWSSGAFKTIIIATSSNITSVTATGTFNQADFAKDPSNQDPNAPPYTGPVHISFWLIPDYGNSDFYSYDIQDSGTSVYTGLPSGCPTAGSPDTGPQVNCSYAFTGLAAGSSHHYTIGTVYAHEATTNPYIPASPTPVTVPSACPLPDLTAGNTAAPSSGTTGQSESFSASASNNGSANATTNVPNVFQIANSASTTVAWVDGGTASSLAMGGSFAMNGSYTFNTPDNYYIRACANMNTSGVVGPPDGVSESNTLNNCGSWQLAPVSQSVISCPNNANNPPDCDQCDSGYVYNSGSCVVQPSATLSASPLTVNRGQSSTLTWTSTHATSCTGTGFTAGGKSGSVSTGALNTLGYSNYQIVCSRGGVDSPRAFAAVHVISPDVSITADPARVLPDASTTVSWTSTNTTSCTITKTGDPNPPWVSGSGSTSGSNIDWDVSTQTVYTITCHTLGADVTSSTTVNVGPSYIEF